MPGAAISDKRVDCAPAAQRDPIIFGREAVRAGALRRIAKEFTARSAALRRQFVLAQISPKRFCFRFFEERFYFANGSPAVVLCLAHTAPKIKLACMHRLPPWPLTIPSLAFFT